MASSTSHMVPASSVVPGWRVRVGETWHVVLIAISTLLGDKTTRVWLYVEGKPQPIIIPSDEEIEASDDDAEDAGPKTQ